MTTSSMNRLRWLAVAVAAGLSAVAATVALALLSAPKEAPVFSATDVSGVSWGRNFRLIGHDGKRRSLEDFRGKVVALYFGYTRCPDVCSVTMTTLGQAVRQLGDDANMVQGLFVSIDPRDTPMMLARYVRAFHESFIGLYGDPDSIARTAREFKVDVSEDHSAQLFIFDTQGRLRLIFRPEAAADMIAHDVRLLLVAARDEIS